MSFGVWVQRIQVNANSAGRGNGEADFTSLQTFLEGIPINFVGVPNKTVMYWRSTVGAWYVQDVIQLRHNLTLRAGIRHEFTNGWNEKYGRLRTISPMPMASPLATRRIAPRTSARRRSRKITRPSCLVPAWA